ncbi:MAG: phosphoadenosine phosphosulfate reductase family protein, partial [Caldilineaceae bacterium]|nr:phosphoadenosine phosphosulfate reductase family protein [Caldilineaceae bacterium]
MSIKNDSSDLDLLNQRLEGSSPQDILIWAWETFGPSVAATSSFQTQSLPLLHIIARTTPKLPVFFLDTGFHFPETLALRDRLMREWGLTVQSLRAEQGQESFRQQYGQLYRTDPDRC